MCLAFAFTPSWAHPGNRFCFPAGSPWTKRSGTPCRCSEFRVRCRAWLWTGSTTFFTGPAWGAARFTLACWMVQLSARWSQGCRNLLPWPWILSTGGTLEFREISTLKNAKGWTLTLWFLRLLFWAQSGDSPKIERSGLDGRDRKALVTHFIRQPVALGLGRFKFHSPALGFELLWGKVCKRRKHCWAAALHCSPLWVNTKNFIRMRRAVGFTACNCHKERW